jgi:hypothetical protein
MHACYHMPGYAEKEAFLVEERLVDAGFDGCRFSRASSPCAGAAEYDPATGANQHIRSASIIMKECRTRRLQRRRTRLRIQHFDILLLTRVSDLHLGIIYTAQ